MRSDGGHVVDWFYDGVARLSPPKKNLAAWYTTFTSSMDKALVWCKKIYCSQIAGERQWEETERSERGDRERNSEESCAPSPLPQPHTQKHRHTFMGHETLEQMSSDSLCTYLERYVNVRIYRCAYGHTYPKTCLRIHRSIYEYLRTSSVSVSLTRIHTHRNASEKHLGDERASCDVIAASAIQRQSKVCSAFYLK